MREISSLLIGEIDRPEFHGARSTLQSLGRVSCFATVESAAQALSTGEIIADFIVVAQTFPRQFSHQAIDRLRRLAPLSRVLGLLGSWCEGEMRSGHPWPAAVRVYWHQWNVRAQRELRRLVQGRCPSWALPITATEEERLLRSTTTIPRRRGLIAIHARGFVMADWLSAACRMCGYSTVWLRPGQHTRIKGAAAAIFDGSDLDAEEYDQLRLFINTLTRAAPATQGIGDSGLGISEQLSVQDARNTRSNLNTMTLNRTPLIVLLDFPRIEDQHRAFAAGATAILSKPLGFDDLICQLDRTAD